MAATIGFRPTDDDARILRDAARAGETTADTIRRALRLLDQYAWESQFRSEASQIADEDLNAEPEAW